ncbi:transposase [Staphylococcus epidermidis]|uniref:helix-turn-helix domain-containing protein n=1 Tax=Staphylococcus epidermidis TaxID=1282 RepID=UPI000E02ED17|nr:helix-turn-helix domain-containing protein [Staphylococcus epidermidis]SUM53553.1 transposase [Staphylococcus epidermidis]
MGKHYKLEFKLKVVQEYLEGTLGCTRLTKKYNISNESVVRRWVHQYLEFGREGLAKKLQNKSYTRVFKVSVLKFRQENKLSYRETANHFKISNPAMIANWQRRFDEEGVLGLDNKREGRFSKMKKKQSKLKYDDSPLNDTEREELERLRNEMLKAGIAYQKKLQALTQNYETKHPKK